MEKLESMTFKLMTVQEKVKTKKIRNRSVIARVKAKGQVTLPVRLRRELGLEEGDYVEVATHGKSVTITPKEMVDRHPEIDRAIEEGLKDVREGRVTPIFRSAKEFQIFRKTKMWKKLAK